MGELLIILRAFAILALAAGVYAIIRWDMLEYDIVSGAVMGAAMLIGIAGIAWGMTEYPTTWRPYMTDIGYICLGVGVFRFFFDRRAWRDGRGRPGQPDQ